MATKPKSEKPATSAPPEVDAPGDTTTAPEVDAPTVADNVGEPEPETETEPEVIEAPPAGQLVVNQSAELMSTEDLKAAAAAIYGTTNLSARGDQGPMDLPVLGCEFKKEDKKIYFFSRLGGGEVEIVKEGVRDGSLSGEIAVMGTPFRANSLFSDSLGKPVCKAINGVPDQRMPQVMAKNCDTCRFSNWVPGPNGRDSKYSEVLEGDTKSTTCRNKLLIPVIWIENRTDADAVIQPCLLVVSPTGLKHWTSLNKSFGKRGAFSKGPKGTLMENVIQVTLSKVSNAAGTMAWAEPTFSAVGPILDVMNPVLQRKILQFQVEYHNTITRFGMKVVEDLDTEDIGGSSRATHGEFHEGARTGRPAAAKVDIGGTGEDDDLPF